MGYITNVDAGCDLVKYGSSLVPFVNRFPTNIRLYELMTAKPGEDSVNREECKIILFSDVVKMGLQIDKRTIFCYNNVQRKEELQCR